MTPNQDELRQLNPVPIAPALEEFASLTGTPLVSPISLTVPNNRPPAAPPPVLPDTSASFPGAGFDPGVSDEFDYFPSANSLAAFRPPEGTGLGTRGVGPGGGPRVGTATPPIGAAEPATAGSSPAAPESTTAGKGLAAALRFLKDEGLYQEMDGIAGHNRKYSDTRLQEEGYDENVRAQVGLIKDNMDRGRHTGGQIAGSDEVVQSGKEGVTPTLEGEFVMTRQAVEMYGLDFFEDLNRRAAEAMGQDPASGDAPPMPARRSRPKTGNANLDQFAEMI